MALIDRIKQRVAIRTRFANAQFNSRVMPRAKRRQHVVVLGDSHTGVFADWDLEGWLFDPLVVGGATASGIRNPNSATEALPRFHHRLAAVKSWQSVMVLLGEVDCGYIIWRRARTEGISVEESLAETLRRYEEFVRDEVLGRQVMVMSAPLPTLPDDSSSWGEVAQRRSDVRISQRDRTAMTIRFNELVAEMWAKFGWKFVDSTTAQLDSSTGLVRDDLVRLGTGDHHLVVRLSFSWRLPGG